MIRGVALVGLLLAVAACDREEKPLPPERPNAQATTIKPQHHVLPEEVDFAGRWATSLDQCETGWWDFGGDEIRNAEGFGCSVMQDERTADTATLQMTCVGDGMPSMESWIIRLGEDSLTVSRPTAPTETLVRCPAY
ncbi:hypothetical protein ACFOMD_03465 [Sphingoaurantiacus capsulatus]|uniref:Lipoprotein n=1 Tax=Sphingoaurantiacus capsulatus TaxID=1771310 RepID=A0ABV7XAC7_9SPHN